MEHGSFLSDTLNEYTEWRERCTEIDLLAWWKQAQGPTKVLVLGVFVFRSFGWLVWFPFIYIYNFHIYIWKFPEAWWEPLPLKVYLKTRQKGCLCLCQLLSPKPSVSAALENHPSWWAKQVCVSSLHRSPVVEREPHDCITTTRIAWIPQ